MTRVVKATTAAVWFGYQSIHGNPVKAVLIGSGDEGGVLVGEHNPEFLKFVGVCDIRSTNRRRIFEVVGRQKRQQCAQLVEDLVFVGSGKMRHAAARVVGHGGAQLLESDILLSQRLSGPWGRGFGSGMLYALRRDSYRACRSLRYYAAWMSPTQRTRTRRALPGR